MPRIPDPYLGGRFSRKMKELRSNKNTLLTISMALVIFIIGAIESVSFFLPDYVGMKEYTKFYFPLLTSIELFIFSLFFVFKSFRYTSCLDTKIVSMLMAFVYLISIIAIILQLKVVYYLVILQPIILIVVLIIMSVNLTRWFLKQP